MPSIKTKNIGPFVTDISKILERAAKITGATVEGFDPSNPKMEDIRIDGYDLGLEVRIDSGKSVKYRLYWDTIEQEGTINRMAIGEPIGDIYWLCDAIRQFRRWMPHQTRKPSAKIISTTRALLSELKVEREIFGLGDLRSKNLQPHGDQGFFLDLDIDGFDLELHLYWRDIWRLRYRDWSCRSLLQIPACPSEVLCKNDKKPHKKWVEKLQKALETHKVLSRIQRGDTFRFMSDEEWDMWVIKNGSFIPLCATVVAPTFVCDTISRANPCMRIKWVETDAHQLRMAEQAAKDRDRADYEFRLRRGWTETENRAIGPDERYEGPIR